MAADLSYYSDPPRPVASRSNRTALLALVAVFVVVATLFGTAATALGPLFGGSGCSFQNGAGGQKLSKLELVGLTVTTRPVTLDDLSGKVALVNFWGTWCGPCRVEAPHIAKLYAQYSRRSDFRLLSVSCGSGYEDLKKLQATTQAFLTQNRLEMPTYADPQSVTRKAFGSFRGYPTTLLLDRDHTIRKVWVGYSVGMEKEMAAEIDQLLAK